MEAKWKVQGGKIKAQASIILSSHMVIELESISEKLLVIQASVLLLDSGGNLYIASVLLLMRGTILEILKGRRNGCNETAGRQEAVCCGRTFKSKEFVILGI